MKLIMDPVLLVLLSYNDNNVNDLRTITQLS